MKSDSITYRLNLTFFKLLQLGYPFLNFDLIYRFKELKSPKSPFKRNIVLNCIQKLDFALNLITYKVQKLENPLQLLFRKRLRNFVSSKIQKCLVLNFNKKE